MLEVPYRLWELRLLADCESGGHFSRRNNHVMKMSVSLFPFLKLAGPVHGLVDTSRCRLICSSAYKRFCLSDTELRLGHLCADEKWIKKFFDFWDLWPDIARVRHVQNCVIIWTHNALVQIGKCCGQRNCQKVGAVNFHSYNRLDLCLSYYTDAY